MADNLPVSDDERRMSRAELYSIITNLRAEVERLRLLLDKVRAEFIHFPSLDDVTLTNREALARVERHWPEGEAAKGEANP